VINTEYFRVDGPITRIGNDVTIRAQRIVINGIGLPPTNWRAALEQIVASGGKSEAEKEEVNRILLTSMADDGSIQIRQVTPTVWEETLMTDLEASRERSSNSGYRLTHVRFTAMPGAELSISGNAKDQLMIQMTITDFNGHKQKVRETDLAGYLQR
jgi:hypothetical protein